MQAAIKPTVTALKRISGGGGLDAKARTLIRFIIDNRLTTPEKARTLFEDTERELQRVLSAQNAPTDAATRARPATLTRWSAARRSKAWRPMTWRRSIARRESYWKGRWGATWSRWCRRRIPTLVGPTGQPIMVLTPAGNARTPPDCARARKRSRVLAPRVDGGRANSGANKRAPAWKRRKPWSGRSVMR